MSLSDDLLLEHIGTSLPISCWRNMDRVLARAKSCRRHRFEFDRYTWDTVSELLPLMIMLGGWPEDAAPAPGVGCDGPLAGLTLPDEDVDVAEDM